MSRSSLRSAKASRASEPLEKQRHQLRSLLARSPRPLPCPALSLGPRPFPSFPSRLVSSLAFSSFLRFRVTFKFSPRRLPACARARANAPTDRGEPDPTTIPNLIPKLQVRSSSGRKRGARVTTSPCLTAPSDADASDARRCSCPVQNAGALESVSLSPQSVPVAVPCLRGRELVPADETRREQNETRRGGKKLPGHRV